jgi:hypothetical protein
MSAPQVIGCTGSRGQDIRSRRDRGEHRERGPDDHSPRDEQTGD